jgi:hypothetical protein
MHFNTCEMKCGMGCGYSYLLGLRLRDLCADEFLYVCVLR